MITKNGNKEENNLIEEMRQSCKKLQFLQNTDVVLPNYLLPRF